MTWVGSNSCPTRRGRHSTRSSRRSPNGLNASSLTITIHAFDEGWNFAFIGSIRGGHYLGQAVEAIDALYQGVYQRVDEVVVA